MCDYVFKDETLKVIGNYSLCLIYIRIQFILIASLIFKISLQESRERMIELLDVDPKEEDLECREEFPGKA